MSSDTLERSNFSQLYRVARGLHDCGLYEDCIALVEYFLKDENLPRYYQIRMRFLLIYCTKDWQKAEHQRLLCESLYSTAIMLWSGVKDALVGFDKLRHILDAIRAEQGETAPQGDDMDLQDE